MYPLILKITHNIRAKDSIAIFRGVYRVIEGGINNATQSQTRKSSWMDPPIIKHIVKEHPEIKSQQFQVENDTKVNQYYTSKQRKESSKHYQKTSIEAQASYQPKLTVEQNIQIKVPKDSQNQPQLKKQKQYLKSFHQSDKLQVFTPTESVMPQSRFSRFFQFGKLGISLASAEIFSSKEKDESYYQDVAEKLSTQLCKMRGAPLKLAQILSIQQNDLISAPIRKAFEKARQSAHVIPKNEVQFMMKKSLGDTWRDNFKQFSDKPLAAASIGQVHYAILKSNNEEVAIKVQYNAVKQSIDSDINNLKMLLKLPKLFPKSMYMERILKNTRKQLLQECNYNRQRTFQQLYEQCLNRCLSDSKQAQLYKVPKVIEQLSTGQILTQQYVSGIKMKEFEDKQQHSEAIRNQLGRRIMLLTFTELFSMGIMQSDPNPSNFTYNFLTDQLNLYDFGATHIYSPKFLSEYFNIIQGSVQSNQQKIWDASIETGFVTGQQNSVMKKSHIQSIMIIGEPLRYKGEYDFGKQQITKRVYETIPLMLKNRLKPPPEQVYSLHRKLSGSYLACIRLKAKVDCHQIFSNIKFQTLASEQQYQDRIKQFAQLQ